MDLKDPLPAEARHDVEVLAGRVLKSAEIVAELDLAADAGVVADTEPKLGLGKEHDIILPPYIGEAGEAESRHSEKVLKTPYGGKLHGQLGVHADELLVEDLEVEGIVEVGRMHEVVDAEEECAVDTEAESQTAVVLVLEAEGAQGAVLPEVQAAGDLEVRTAGRDDLSAGVLVVVVVVDEEEGVAPIVSVKTLEGRGEVLATEVVEGLEVGLGLRSLSEEQRSKSGGNENFFHHFWF